ncbi:MAG: cache domain-containing protein [Acetobacteraceae bacterium]|jgi:hypothetical protein
MKTRTLILFTMLAGLLGATAQPGDRGTPEEAKAMAVKAAQFLRDSGPEAAFGAFDAATGPWHDRDLYVFVADQSEKMLANGGNVALIGRMMTALKDVDGLAIGAAIAAVKDEGWVEYKWQNPVTKSIEPKMAYVVRVGKFSVGVGAYK